MFAARGAAAVEDRHLVRGGPPPRVAERGADGIRHRRGIGAGRGASRADGPDRLVGDHEAGGPQGGGVVTGQRARQLRAATTSTARPASRSSSSSPTQRMGRSPASTARPSFGRSGRRSRRRRGGARSGRGSPRWRGRPASARSSRPCRPRRARGGCSGRRRRSPPPRRASRTAARQTVRRADHPNHVGLAGSPGDRAGQLAGVGGRGVHLPVGGNDDGSHDADHATRRPARRGCARPVVARPFGPRRAGARSAGPGSRRRRGGRPTRSAPGRAAPGRAGSPSSAASSAERGLRDRTARRRPPREPAPACDVEAAVGLERRDRVELAGGGERDPLQVRGLGVEEPVEVPADGPAHLARLELEERGAGADPAQEGPDVVARPSRSRRRVPAAAGPRAGRPIDASRAPSCAASSAGTTNSRWSRPWATDSEPRARNRPRSQAARQ